MNASLSTLKNSITGDLYTDELHRYMVSTDASIFRVNPACVVYPRNTEDVCRVAAFATANKMAVHCRGAGSGLCGSAVGSGIVLDFTKYMNRLIKIDRDKKYFECRPGFRLGELKTALKGTGLFFPPDPSSGEYASLGGMYCANASGAHSVKYGNVSDYIVDARIVLASGCVITVSDISAAVFSELPDNFKHLFQLYEEHIEIIKNSYPNVRHNVAGYNLRKLVQKGRLHLEKLFSGSEGTLGIVTRLKFRLVEKPSFDSLVVAFFNNIVDSARAVQMILPMAPSGIEVMDKSILDFARGNETSLRDKIPGNIDNVLLIEFDSHNEEQCVLQARSAMELLQKEKLPANAHLAVSDEEKERFWAIRKAAVPILYKIKSDKKVLALIEDAAVPTARLVEYFNGIYGILNRHNVAFVVYGHIAKGLMHTRPLLNLKDPADIKLLKILADEVFLLVRSLGGSISGEHGDGRLRSGYIKEQYPEIYHLFCETKRLLDPKNTLNPAIKTGIDPNQSWNNLRYGKNYLGRDFLKEHLLWPEGFVNEIEKCHGCTKCTTVTTATRMCPVYKFTRDEAASPKAKANILRALISGAVEDKALFSRAFQQVIDKCTACGSCHHECPSNVNIPKMAVEARARYVKQFGIPLSSRLVTGLELAGRTTRKFSPAIASVMGSSVIRRAGEMLTGISARREFDPPARRCLAERIRPEEGKGDLKILYFAGCYASYMRPEIGESAIKVLTRMDMTVYTPVQHCCGLPMLSKGMVPQARRAVEKNLEAWGHLLDMVDHIVVTCSSCGLALMKEWACVTRDAMADRVADKILHISRLVNDHASRLNMNHHSLKVAYHTPCHLKVQPDPDSSIKMLSRITGLRVEPLDSHCCGMAGTWGLYAANYDLSTRIGSDLIDKLKTSNPQITATDCPTCRMQLDQLGAGTVRHPIEVLSASLTH
ncbi:MAG: sn-glycerol-3-phosphate dehydrogenase subunit C [Desulfobacteraceae bacterium 4572_123]|nr:MAG: sn-glycerol-3-phosphate dehydrogenase subunit C [Desulfobacteraceae bacterium 4572_123]